MNDFYCNRCGHRFKLYRASCAVSVLCFRCWTENQSPAVLARIAISMGPLHCTGQMVRTHKHVACADFVSYEWSLIRTHKHVACADFVSYEWSHSSQERFYQ